MGFVTPEKVALPPPAQEPVFSVAVQPNDRALPFYVVEARQPVAVVLTGGPLLRTEAEEAMAAQLRGAGLPVVVLVGLEAEGAAVARCYSAVGEALEDAACAVWALKAIGGWEECPLMTFYISQVGAIDRGYRSIMVSEAAWLTTRAVFASGAWSIDVTRPTAGSWSALLSEIDRDRSSVAVLLADVDWAKPYNDAYGHEHGDLMLARIHGRIEAIAMKERATFLRVAGDKFALVIREAPERAPSIAEAIPREVESLAIPFEQEDVPTSGHVTVSVGVALRPHRPDLRAVLEDAVYSAKRRGRNRVATSRP